jgi:hypothetical protein
MAEASCGRHFGWDGPWQDGAKIQRNQNDIQTKVEKIMKKFNSRRRMEPVRAGMPATTGHGRCRLREVLYKKEYSGAVAAKTGQLMKVVEGCAKILSWSDGFRVDPRDAGR